MSFSQRKKRPFFTNRNNVDQLGAARLPSTFYTIGKSINSILREFFSEKFD